MADIRDVVAGAVKEAESGIVPDRPDSTEETSTGTTVVDFGGSDAGEEAEAKTETAVSPSSATAQTEAPKKDLAGTVDKTKPQPVDDELSKEMARHGIHPPKEGQREGVFKWSKVRKVLENTRAKVAEKYERELATTRTQLEQSSARLQNMDVVDKMILTDPDRYIRTLAAIHPQLYGKYVGMQAEEKPKPAARPDADDPMPQPDAEFPDGSKGYSLDQQMKREEWLQRRITRTVTAEVEQRYNQRFGPIEQDWKQAQLARAAEVQRERARPGVRAQIMNAKKIWGPLFQSTLTGDPQDDPEILQAMDDHPDWSFDACVASVLTPKMQADREAMRKDVLDEIRKAPAAATRSVPGAALGTGTGRPRTTAEIVAEAVAAASRG
jgi:hypothetical protein